MLRHLLIPDWWSRHAYSHGDVHKIEAAIRDSETQHDGEIRFVVESSLSFYKLLRGTSARERALELFSELKIWDTEHNNGVLIYLLLAEKDIEIIADRGIHQRVGTKAWEEICKRMEQTLNQRQYLAGILQGIDAINALLVQHYPASGHKANELPDRPVML